MESGTFFNGLRYRNNGRICDNNRHASNVETDNAALDNQEETNSEDPFHVEYSTAFQMETMLGEKALSRYIPICIVICMKLASDYWINILDLIVLQLAMHQFNTALLQQIKKFPQVGSTRVMRLNLSIIAGIVFIRFRYNDVPPDPFGLLIAPSVFGATAKSSMANNSLHNLSQVENLAPISLTVLLYFVAVNDLILKLITIFAKTSVTLIPTKNLNKLHKAHWYALIEHFSQLYRSIAPIRIWLQYLYPSYTGWAKLSGVILTTVYVSAKSYELSQQIRMFRLSIINLRKNHSIQKPSQEEIIKAGSLCAICHSNFRKPIILECKHIFCKNCANTWFKCMTTCPMCRAKVNEDFPNQDGSTSYFYQLF